MTARRRSIVLITMAVALVLLQATFGRVIVGGIKASLWHMLHGSEIEFHNVEISLPLAWWQHARDQGHLTLTRIGHRKQRTFGVVVVATELWTPDELDQFKPDQSKGKSLERAGTMRELRTGEESVYEVEYRVEDQAPGFGLAVIRWSIPSRSIVVDATYVEPQDKDLIITELLENIRFR